MIKSVRIVVAAVLASGCFGSCLADDLQAEQKFEDAVVGFDLKGTFSNLTLSIAGPNDFTATSFSKSGAPSIDLRRFGTLEDGTYTYHLTAATDEKVKSRTRLDNGRDRGSAEPLRSVSTSGTFNVKDGVIVKRVSAKPNKRDE
jgi:hypothetical protein